MRRASLPAHVTLPAWPALVCALVAVFAGCRDDDGSAGDRGRADAGACWFDISQIDQHYWKTPCPAQLPDPGIYACYRDGGILTYVTSCGQREVLTWSWGSHAQTCFYEAGSLVGLVMADDVPSFCNHTAAFIEIGVTAGCPADTPMVSPQCSREGDTLVDGGAPQDAGGGEP